MKPLQLAFLKSAPDISTLPADNGSEVIIVGYSNVGKSSFINAMANVKNLAKSSKTPGRTQLFNVFEIDHERRVLDLPGYGFAKVARSLQDNWQTQMQNYLAQRQCLKGMVMVVDIRRSLRPIDEELLHWSREQNVPMLIVLNKADKLSRQQVNQTVAKIKGQFGLSSQEVTACSSTNKTGLAEPLKTLISWLSLGETS